MSTKVCKGFCKCSFYKTKTQADEDRESADARLRSLPLEQQLSIAAAYFKGEMPWRKEAE